VGLGTAGRFAVLAGAGVTNTGNTVVTGDRSSRQQGIAGLSSDRRGSPNRHTGRAFARRPDSGQENRGRNCGQSCRRERTGRTGRQRAIRLGRRPHPEAPHLPTSRSHSAEVRGGALAPQSSWLCTPTPGASRQRPFRGAVCSAAVARQGRPARPDPAAGRAGHPALRRREPVAVGPLPLGHASAVDRLSPERTSRLPRVVPSLAWMWRSANCGRISESG